MSFAAALKLSKASRYCPAQTHLLTQKILSYTGQRRCHLFAITRDPLQHTCLGLGTTLPEESFAKLCSTLWLTLGRLQQKSGFCGISECNIFVTCR